MSPDQQLARHYEAALLQILHLENLHSDAANLAAAALGIARRALAARCAHCGEPVDNPDTHVCEGRGQAA